MRKKMFSQIVARTLAALVGLSAVPVFADIGQIRQALANPARPEVDRQMDAQRKPAEVLEFFQIEPRMTVLDIFGGGGYYAEILSYLVGEQGFVTLYNNEAWHQYMLNGIEARLADDRLPNVDNYVADPADLINQPDQFDAAVFILGAHDVYVDDPQNDWPLIDRERFFKGIYKVITPGGVLGVVDHNALEGTDPAVVSKALHRIDPAVIIRDLQAVGFTLEAESQLLRNADDDRSMPMSEPAYRWHTDRSVLRFRK
jgi:predicted methyltransferase